MDVPVKLVNAGDASADVTSPGVNVGRTPYKSIVATFSGGGSPVGTLYLQVSMDNSNWVSVGNTAVSGDGSYRVAVAAGDWIMRAFYDASTGSGSVTVWAFSV